MNRFLLKSAKDVTFGQRFAQPSASRSRVPSQQFERPDLEPMQPYGLL